jgi:hypothetical protein
MRNLFLLGQNLFRGNKMCAATLMALCLLGWNYNAFGQCNILNGETIKIIGSDKICPGSVPQLEVEGANGYIGVSQ